ncbi:MAG TPA: GGDEF domain-containing protein, partial [Vicinamibacteria bacterium]|nr:GGDEF domain-containing protein [Vicinamibacteria bacterium]
ALVLNRRAASGVVEDAKRRLLEAAVAARGGAPLGRVRPRLFAPPGSGHSTEEVALAAFASFPVVTNSRLAGLLVVGGRAVGRMTPETGVFLGQVANQAYTVLQNSRLFERVNNLAIRDSLTELFNHRHIMDLLHHEFDRAGRYDDAFSVLMIDVDHFKRINDDHGHQAGDAVLREVSHLLRDTLRTVDSVGRYGGEEFVALLPHTGAEEARQTADRLRQKVQARTFTAGGREVRVTVSVGVATSPMPGVDSAAALVREADKALYRAKGGGRNQVA